MLANIKNGQLVRRNFIIQRRKRICESILKILWEEGYISGYSVNSLNNLKIFLKYKNKVPVISSLKTISKPSRRIYFSAKQIWKLDSSKQFIIFSTTKGLKSINDCKKLHLGGEPIFSIN